MKLSLSSLSLFLFPVFFASLQPVWNNPSLETEQPAACNLPAPASIDIQLNGSGCAELSWPAVSGAYAYTLAGTDNGIPFLQTTVIGTSRTVTGMVSGHNYHFTVSSKCDGSQTSSYIITYDINP